MVNDVSIIVSYLSPVILVSTIDGRIHAIEVDDLNENLNILWSLNTEKLISSSINKLEVCVCEYVLKKGMSLLF